MNNLQLSINALDRYIGELKKIENAFLSDAEKIRRSTLRASGWQDDGYLNVLRSLNIIFKEVNLILDSIHGVINACNKVGLIANDYSNYMS